MPSALDPHLVEILKHDHRYLAQTELPIITVSASFREDLKNLHGIPDNEWLPDVVFSRAHFSMAVAIAVQAWGNEGAQPQKAWIFDPTNYVTTGDWRSIIFTEYVGKTLARQPFLKKIKDFLDRYARNSLPILKSITPPLLLATRAIKRPILSLHIAAGNVLIEHGRQVVQVVTDPHVRSDYLIHANNKNMTYCVFDEKTKTDLLEKAAVMETEIDPKRVVVTGPPVDPRIVTSRSQKQPWRSGKLRLVITTGGLGTNKSEIRKLLRQLLPELRKKEPRFQLFVYAGTQLDFCEMAHRIAQEERIPLEPIHHASAPLRVAYHPQIVDANELLVAYGFPWADGFITKPSGDMAYDAVAAGCFILTMTEWGVWEHNISEYFEQKGIARKAEIENIVPQLTSLMQARGKDASWIEKSMLAAANLKGQLLTGSANIIATYKKVAEKS